MSVFVCAHVYVRCVCVCVCMCVCVHVCLFMCLRKCVCVCVRERERVFVRVCRRAVAGRLLELTGTPYRALLVFSGISTPHCGKRRTSSGGCGLERRTRLQAICSKKFVNSRNILIFNCTNHIT